MNLCRRRIISSTAQFLILRVAPHLYKRLTVDHLAGERRLAMVRLVALLVGLASGVAVPASAQDKTDIEALRKQGYSVRMISPIFSQLVMLSLPKGFTTVFEDTSGSQYTREAVLEGEIGRALVPDDHGDGGEGARVEPASERAVLRRADRRRLQECLPGHVFGEGARRPQDQRPRCVHRARRLRNGVVGRQRAQRDRPCWSPSRARPTTTRSSGPSAAPHRPGR